MGFLGESGAEVRGIIAFVGIGANLGKPAEACREAIERMGEVPGVRVLRWSSLYRTMPVGPQDQPPFINAVAEIRTDLAPRQLLLILKEIERQMGRTAGPKWGPRIIDLDLLFYGQEVIQEGGLQIPHPELHRRAFVLIPLCELASYLIHPAFGVSIRGLLDRLPEKGGVEIYEQAIPPGDPEGAQGSGKEEPAVKVER
jgi:2-amino-4-hydroxy-6-hydroxymethyldihydropteridine diphosphokinase